MIQSWFVQFGESIFYSVQFEPKIFKNSSICIAKILPSNVPFRTFVKRLQSRKSALWLVVISTLEVALIRSQGIQFLAEGFPPVCRFGRFGLQVADFRFYGADLGFCFLHGPSGVLISSIFTLSARDFSISILTRQSIVETD